MVFYRDINTVINDKLEYENIDLLITLIDKDIVVAKKCIESVRSFSLNKINKVYILAPDSDLIKDFCEKYNCIFINEDYISPYNTNELLVRGIKKEKVGWIKQQLIKLNSDKIDNLLDNYLIIDADTILLKHQFFYSNKFSVIKFSDEYHILYKISSKFILGDFFYSIKSFISHHQIIQKNILIDMKSHIESMHKKKWYDVFIQAANKNKNYVSEYEIYAQFCIKKLKINVKQQYWFNVNNKIQDIKNSKRLDPKAQSISYHNYINGK